MVINCVHFYNIDPKNISSGKCVDDLTWTMDREAKTLTISGTGRMTDYYCDSLISRTPWFNIRSGGPYKLILNEVMKYIGRCAFYNFVLSGDVRIQGTVTEIGDNAFNICWGDEGELIFSEGLQYISDYAFCSTLFNGELRLPDTVEEIGDYAFYNQYKCRDFWE